MLIRRTVPTKSGECCGSSTKCNGPPIPNFTNARGSARAVSFVTGAAHPDATQPVTADFSRSTERKIQHSAVRKRSTILDRAFDFFAVVEIGDDKDRAERFRAVSARDLVRMEALAARVPFVFPIDGGFLIIGGWTRDATHPDLLKRVGVRR